MNKSEEKGPLLSKDFNRKVLNGIGMLTVCALLVLLVLFGFRVILLILAGVLVAAFFLGIASFIENKTPLNHNFSLAISMLLVLGILIGTSYALMPHISEQVATLKEELPKAATGTLDNIRDTQVGSLLVERIENMELNAKQGQIASFFGSVFGLFSTLYIILFLGIFFTVAPETYLNGMVKLFPKTHRSRSKEILVAMGKTLKNWLLGKLFSMLIVGVLTGIGLSILGIPLALTLAIFAALISFIPNFGPLIALVPAFLLAFMESPTTALYILILYGGIQALESNILTPMIQKKMIALPMAMILIAQIVLGLFTGILGVILAVPLVAILMVWVKMAYIEDVLGDYTIEVEYDSSEDKE